MRQGLRRAVFFAVASCGVLSAVPSRADYVLQWSAQAFRFPDQGGGITVNPFPPSFFGDVDGDGQQELVGISDTHHILVRDALTGTIEGQIETPYDEPIYSISIVSLANLGPPQIVVIFSGGIGYPAGIAVYGWVGAIAASPQPTQNAERLLSAAPNPFTPRTTLSFVVDAPGNAELDIVDVSGRLVRHFIEAGAKPGQHMVEWDGKDELGRRLAAGTYFYALKLNGHTVGSQKAVLLQ